MEQEKEVISVRIDKELADKLRDIAVKRTPESEDVNLSIFIREAIHLYLKLQ